MCCYFNVQFQGQRVNCVSQLSVPYMSIKSSGDKRTDGPTDFIRHSAVVRTPSRSKKYLDDQEMDENYEDGVERQCNRRSGRHVVHTSWFPIAFPYLLPPHPLPHWLEETSLSYIFWQRQPLYLETAKLSQARSLKCYSVRRVFNSRHFERSVPFICGTNDRNVRNCKPNDTE